MCHKKIGRNQDDNLDVDDEPDYVFYVNQLRAPLMTSQLDDLNIKYKEFRCKSYLFLF